MARREAWQGEERRLRVIYYHFEKENVIWLLTMYGKGEIEDLSPNEKKLLRTAIEREKRARKTKRRT